MMRAITLVGCFIMAMVVAAAQPQQTIPGIPAQVMPQSQASQYFAQQPPSAGMPGTVSQKRPGIALIGIAPPAAQIGPGNENIDTSEAIRNTIIQYFQGPLVDVMLLSSRIEVQLQAEAKQKGCDYIFQSSVTQKKGGGMFGKLSSVGMIASSVTPMAGMAGNAGSIAAGVASNAAVTAATVASGFKNKDEISFQYKVTTPDSAVVATNTSKVKAKQDGDDVLSPQIQQAIAATLEAVSKKTQQ